MTDDIDSLEVMAAKEIESAIFRKVFFILLAGAIAFGGFIGLGGVRPDPATGTELKAVEAHAKAARNELKAEMERYVVREIQHAEILLRAEMPPQKTKAKIRALEASADRVDPEFEPVYDGW